MALTKHLVHLVLRVPGICSQIQGCRPKTRNGDRSPMPKKSFGAASIPVVWHGCVFEMRSKHAWSFEKRSLRINTNQGMQMKMPKVAAYSLQLTPSFTSSRCAQVLMSTTSKGLMRSQFPALCAWGAVDPTRQAGGFLSASGLHEQAEAHDKSIRSPAST